jgi:hypothetical protein
MKFDVSVRIMFDSTWEPADMGKVRVYGLLSHVQLNAGLIRIFTVLRASLAINQR